MCHCGNLIGVHSSGKLAAAVRFNFIMHLPIFSLSSMCFESPKIFSEEEDLILFQWLFALPHILTPGKSKAFTSTT